MNWKRILHLDKYLTFAPTKPKQKTAPTKKQLQPKHPKMTYHPGTLKFYNDKNILIKTHELLMPIIPQKGEKIDISGFDLPEITPDDNTFEVQAMSYKLDKEQNRLHPIVQIGSPLDETLW